MKADLKTQIDFEELYHKNQLNKRLNSVFHVPEVTEHCEKNGIPIKFGVQLLGQMVLHKRTQLSVLVGVLHRHFEHMENPFQACADMIDQAVKCGMVTYNKEYRVFIMKIDMDQSVYDDLDRYQYPLPALIEPKEVETNSQNGYHSFGVQSSLILKNNHHNGDLCLDHINRCNRVTYSINGDTAQMIKNTWRNLDKRKDGETASDYQRRVKSFEKYDRASKDVISVLNQWGNEFYLTHRYDKRGRTYCQGYHVNYQGNAWNKAVIEFSNKEVTPID